MSKKCCSECRVEIKAEDFNLVYDGINHCWNCTKWIGGSNGK